MLRACCTIVGHKNVFSQITSGITEALEQFPQTMNWEIIEAFLFAVRIIARTAFDCPELVTVSCLTIISLTF